MLSNERINEIRASLERAQNPLFFYDNDADGLCSFLILRKYIGRGRGVAVRSYPDLNASYAKRAQELNADFIFILDKPVVSKEFFDEIERMQIPLVWIDHHSIQGDRPNISDNISVYNSALEGDKKAEPVTYISYKISERKEDSWIALIGCISDHFMPPFYKEFAEQYPELWAKNIKEPFDVYYKTEMGKIARALNFGLKDSITNVVNLQNFLIRCKTPMDVLSEVSENSTFRKKNQDIEKKYLNLLDKAKKKIDGKMIFFEYSGDLSISSELSNELSYFYPSKYILVVYKKGSIANVSIRGKKVKEILEKILPELENASGGGHEDAVGARIKIEDVSKFKELFEKSINF